MSTQPQPYKRRNKVVEEAEESTVSSTFKKLDFYPKNKETVIEKSTWSGLVSIIICVVLGILFLFEAVLFIKTTRKDTLSVDTSVGGRLHIEFDISFPAIPCRKLSLDVVDSTGDQQNDVEQDIDKTSLDLEGNKLPDNAAQRRRVGCNMAGYLSVGRVAGNFHFAPGSSRSESHGSHSHHVHEFDPFTLMSFNTSHIIHKLAFGPKIPNIVNPLDGVSQRSQNPSLYKYFIKIVPTTYQCSTCFRPVESGQYSVNLHHREGRPGAMNFLPGVFFMYDLSPIMIQYEDTRMPFTHFLVNLCAVVGGVFTVSGYTTKFVSYVLSQVKKQSYTSTRKPGIL
eukprot:gb/GECH01014416.1/.p1 GENE.gb/GECH01014416.1/~~gb/GECH01014416.1/.p1  ORF type:complete len:339 (+),score=52.54 gb/GECH01014416.1/:1-1017(+)